MTGLFVDRPAVLHVHFEYGAPCDENLYPLFAAGVVLHVARFGIGCAEQFFGLLSAGFGRGGIGARHLQFRAADRIVAVEVTFVVQHDARYGVNHHHACEKVGKVAVDDPRPPANLRASFSARLRRRLHGRRTFRCGKCSNTPCLRVHGGRRSSRGVRGSAL